MAIKWLASAIRSKWVRLIIDAAPCPGSWVPWKTKRIGIDSSRRAGTNIRKARSRPESINVMSRKDPATRTGDGKRKAASAAAEAALVLVLVSPPLRNARLRSYKRIESESLRLDQFGMSELRIWNVASLRVPKRNTKTLAIR